MCHLRNLLTSLQNHVLGECVISSKDDSRGMSEILLKHLKYLFPHAIFIFNRMYNILEKFPDSLNLLNRIINDSLAGAMLLKIFNSLLLISSSLVRDSLSFVIEMLQPLSQLNKYLSSAIQEEEECHSGKFTASII